MKRKALAAIMAVAMACLLYTSDKIAEQNFNRLENMDLYNRLTPAVLAYEGISNTDGAIY